MKIAVFSDVHGNLINLKSFFESAEKLGIEKFICLGDLCNYYPDNKEVIEFISKKNMTCVLGNHDSLYINNTALNIETKKAYSFDESLLQSQEHVDFLKSLPHKEVLTFGKSTILFCHGSPNDLLNEYVYPDTDLSKFDEVPYDMIFFGHTHRQFLKTHNSKTFCNVGSIGLPRDNGTLLGFAVLNTVTGNIQLYRKEINVTEVKKAYELKTTPEVIGLLDRKETISYNYTLLNG